MDLLKVVRANSLTLARARTHTGTKTSVIRTFSLVYVRTPNHGKVCADSSGSSR